MNLLLQMKNRLLLVFVCLILEVGVCRGQEQNEVNLENLRTPAAPGFILLDVAPSSIEKPTTPKSFSASILHAITQNNGIPRNFALEFTPFWFLKHPRMTAFKFYGIHADTKKQNPFFSLRNASLSVAAVTIDGNGSAGLATNNISFGLRSTIVSIRRMTDKNDLIKSHNAVATTLNELAKKIALINLNDPNRSDSIQKLQALIASEILKENNTLKEVLARKPLFSLDGALAGNTSYSNTTYSNGRFSRYGGWLTADLSMPLDEKGPVKNYVNLLAILRYISKNDSLTLDNNYLQENLVDYGGRFELELGKLSVSYELLIRKNTIGGDTQRAAGLIQYKLGNGIYLSGTIGRNFGNTNNLIALFGINWGLGNEKIVVDR